MKPGMAPNPVIINTSVNRYDEKNNAWLYKHLQENLITEN